MNIFKIQYIDINQDWCAIAKQLIKKHDIKEIFVFYPVDKTLEDRLKILPYYTIVNTPRFILTVDELHSYDGALRNQSFYAWIRRTKNILMIDYDNTLESGTFKRQPIGQKMSFDNENRKKPYKGIEIDIPKDIAYQGINTNKKYLDEAVQYVVKNIPYKNITINCTESQYNNATTLHDLNLKLLFPINHKDSRKVQFSKNLRFFENVSLDKQSLSKVLKNFIKYKLNFFGDYQDIILKEKLSILYHSGISPMLNIGLLTPELIVDEVIKYYNKLSKIEKVKQLHNVEGFIRQIIGWRELCRLFYEIHYNEIINAKNKLDVSYYN
jgi:deoxyribodipyrimidine photolyase-related protein